MVPANKSLCISILTSLFLGVTTAHAEDLQQADYVLKPFSTDFQRLAKIAGLWERKKTDTQGETDVQVEYRLTSGNTALVERLFKDSPHEMVSVYHDDGRSIMMTHYCGFGNQPRMRAKGFDGETLRFEFLDGSNMESNRESHMLAMTIKFLDDGRMQHEWEMYMDGQKQQTVSLTLG